MKRRALLKIAPAVGLAGVMAGSVALAAPADPVIALVAEWKAAAKAWEDYSGSEEDPQYERLMWAREGIADRIAEMEPVSPEGVTALLEFVWLDDGGDFAGDYVSVRKAVLANILTASGRGHILAAA